MVKVKQSHALKQTFVISHPLLWSSIKGLIQSLILSSLSFVEDITGFELVGAVGCLVECHIFNDAEVHDTHISHQCQQFVF